MVPLDESILPAARETTSSGFPSPALAASKSSAASRAVSEIPAQVYGSSDGASAEVWFPDELARFSKNCEHRRSFEDDAVALRGAHARGPEPRRIYLYAFGEVDVCKEGRSLGGATHEH